MHLEKHITIVTGTDNHYIPMLAALLVSIDVNYTCHEAVDVYILSDTVSKKNREAINRCKLSSKILIHWLPVSDQIIDGFELPVDKSSYPRNIYMRLFIPYLLPKSVVKALYLDVDMIVQQDISILYNIDLAGLPIGAVVDPKILTFDNPWGGIKNYRELNLDGKLAYFNSGLMLIDLELWKTLDLTRKVLNCVNENQIFLNYPDQYALNIVMNDQWLKLDPRWNSFAVIDQDESPFIIHFTERKPFYQTYQGNPYYRNLFFNYLNYTPWKNMRVITEFERFLKKFYNIAKKRFPIGGAS